MNNNRLFWILTLFVGCGLGYLVAKFIGPESTTSTSQNSRAKTEVTVSSEGSRPTARSAKDLKLNKKNNVKPDPIEETNDTPVAKDSIDEKFKTLRDEGKKNFEEAVGGNWGRLRKVIEANPELQENWKQIRELRDKWATLSDAEKPAALEQMVALREKGIILLKAELAKPEAPEPAAPSTATTNNTNSNPAETAPPPEPNAEGPAPNAPPPMVIQ